MPAVGGIVTDNKKAYPGNLTPFVTFTCVVAAMGGLIFGYDIGISGTQSSPSVLIIGISENKQAVLAS